MRARVRFADIQHTTRRDGIRAGLLRSAIYTPDDILRTAEIPPAASSLNEPASVPAETEKPVQEETHNDADE